MLAQHDCAGASADKTVAPGRERGNAFGVAILADKAQDRCRAGYYRDMAAARTRTCLFGRARCCAERRSSARATAAPSAGARGCCTSRHRPK